MSLADNIRDDYQVVDDLESITYRSVASDVDTEYAVEDVLKYLLRTSERQPSNAIYVAGDTQWSIAAATLPDGFTCKPGDEIEDAGGDTHNVLICDHATAKTRWRLTTRNLTLAHKLLDYVEVWIGRTVSGSLQRRQEFKRRAARVAARIQPMDRVTETIRDKRLTVQRYTIYLSRAFDLKVTDQIRSCGVVYSITAINDIQTLGELFSVEAEISP